MGSTVVGQAALSTIFFWPINKILYSQRPKKRKKKNEEEEKHQSKDPKNFRLNSHLPGLGKYGLSTLQKFQPPSG